MSCKCNRQQARTQKSPCVHAVQRDRVHQSPWGLAWRKSTNIAPDSTYMHTYFRWQTAHLILWILWVMLMRTGLMRTVFCYKDVHFVYLSESDFGCMIQQHQQKTFFVRMQKNLNRVNQTEWIICAIFFIYVAFGMHSIWKGLDFFQNNRAEWMVLHLFGVILEYAYKDSSQNIVQAVPFLLS